MPQIRLVLCIICFLLGIYAGNVTAQMESYQSQIILQSSWGSEPGQFGLQQGPELETVGPLTFTVDNFGYIYIYDFINQRIQQFDPAGNFVKIIGTGLIGNALCTDVFGNIFLLDSYTKQVKCLSKKGELIKTIKLADELQLIEGYAQGIAVDAENNLVVNRVDQRVHPIATISNSGLISQTPTPLVKEVKIGYLGKTDKNRYRMQWRNAHQADIIITNGITNSAVGSISMTTEDEFGAVLFLGQDTAGNIYTEIERTDVNEILHLEVWKYNSDRKLVAVVEVPNDYFATVYKKLEVDAAGNIYQMHIIPKGVRIIKYSKQN
ncbi:MAG: hypothetical protein N3A72_03830 [bacterium]|nr:hypothetical protein [bacterium]